MGALGHYLEDSGIATASISLIRLHTEKIRPPRALWVPFELGRPLGVPGDPEFQTRVLQALLDLLRAESGPVLEDFPEDATSPASAEAATWSCPVSFDRPAAEETLAVAVHREIRQLQPWHDLAVQRRGRSTFGTAGLTIEAVADLLLGCLDGPPPDQAALKLASEDLKVFYFESAAAQPGNMTGRAAADWFWGETQAAQLFVALRERLIVSDDQVLRLTGMNLMVPRDQWGRFGITERWWDAVDKDALPPPRA